jgi:hypothetical protein
MPQNNNPQRQKELEQIAHKVSVLRKLTKETGFFTTRSVGSLLSALSPDELVTVAELSEITPSTK